ncbi:MAG: hypothetical protein AWM53_00391 [Candidatus Dichloromethanomonas elyunquensis]|nr:MAG: hypothetical protein AWM53_00391 [Candidatus Dichloromethanomonas elyunquensis]
MNYIISIIIILLAILMIDKITALYRLKYEKFRTQLEVLKIFSKHECFTKFMDPVQFEKWAAKFLALKGFKIVDIIRSPKDSGKDIIARNEFGQVVYVECKLANPDNWDTPIDRAIAQKLVGAMIGDGIKNGLIITTSILHEDTKEYLNEVNKTGFQVKYIDGEALVRELYDLREVKLPDILESIGISLRKS